MNMMGIKKKTKMTIEEAKELEPGTVLTAPHNSSREILKRVSNGYIVLHYEDAHYYYDTLFLSFEDIVEYEYEVTEEWWEIDIFNGDNIEHVGDWTSDTFIPKKEDTPIYEGFEKHD